MSAYEPAWISVAQVLMSNVPVPPAEIISPPTSLAASTSMAIEGSSMVRRLDRSSSPTIWPSYPITPRTSRPDRRATSANRPASPGEQPQRGRPTFTSMSTSGIRARAAAAMVSSESTATVIRAPERDSSPSLVASTTSLARRRSCPSPARAMPSISSMVAQVNPRCPSDAWWPARAVHLCAFTWGRSREPGNTSLIVRKLDSRPAPSTTRAGVVRSTTFIAGRLSARRPVRGYCPRR